jgi:hypothetical protein
MKQLVLTAYTDITTGSYMKRAFVLLCGNVGDGNGKTANAAGSFLSPVFTEFNELKYNKHSR